MNDGFVSESNSQEKWYCAELFDLLDGRILPARVPNPFIQDLHGYPLREFEAKYLLAQLESHATFHQFTERPGLLMRRANDPVSGLESLIFEPSDSGHPFKIAFRRIAAPLPDQPTGVYNVYGFKLFKNGRKEQFPAPEKVLGWNYSRPVTKAAARERLAEIVQGFKDPIHYYIRRTLDESAIVADSGSANSELVEVIQSEDESWVFMYQPILESDPLPAPPVDVKAKG